MCNVSRSTTSDSINFRQMWQLEWIATAIDRFEKESLFHQIRNRAPHSHFTIMCNGFLLFFYFFVRIYSHFTIGLCYYLCCFCAVEHFLKMSTVHRTEMCKELSKTKAYMKKKNPIECETVSKKLRHLLITYIWLWVRHFFCYPM